MSKAVRFPDTYAPRLDRALRRLGTHLGDPPRLAEAVLRLSDFYLSRPEAPTPWEQEWAQIAYLCYYFPLNYLRMSGVLAEAARVGFFRGTTRYTDFGSGVGTVSLALDDALRGHFEAGHAVERGTQAVRLHKELQGPDATPVTWSAAASSVPATGHVTFFSFALTELERIPAWATEGEALVLVEPATNQDGRRLLQWRADLIDQGWHPWAPCTHEGPCPLLVHSARDWCHDRVPWEAPDWFAALEARLPMKHPTLSHSYLLLRRQPPPAALAGLGRLTGDLRKEKGAARQLVCRSSAREFLSWQKKHGEPPGWPRGELVRLPDDVPVKANELRLLPGQGELAKFET